MAPLATIDYCADELHKTKSIWHRMFWAVPFYMLITRKKSNHPCSSCWVTAYDVIEIIESGK